jgi:hypothetical protein
MKKILITVGMIILLATGSASAALVNYDFSGTISNLGYQMGTGYVPPLFTIGDTFLAHLTFDDVTHAVTSMNYTIGTGGTALTRTLTDLTTYASSATETNGLFAYGTSTSTLTDNWSVQYGPNGNNFSNLLGTDPYSYNFNASITTAVRNGINVTPTPIPAAAWLLGSGLLGLVGIRRRKA